MKVFDCFMFQNELDILEIRFKELYNVVDWFVIVEATTTHTGKPKPLYYLENKERYAAQNDKVIHFITNFNEGYSFQTHIHQSTKAWFRENYQRECLQIPLKFVASENDLIILTDADEIPKASIIQELKKFENNIKPDVALSIQMQLQQYTIEFTTDRVWNHAKIFKYNLLKSRNLLTDIRLENCPIIPNAGYHLSQFGDINFIKTKVESFAESEEYATEKKSVEWLKSCLDAGILHFNKEKLIQIPLEDNLNLPLFFQEKLITENNKVTLTQNPRRKIGWLVNDCLTCIPNTRTFWHDLLDWFPDLCDMTFGHTDYSVLADRIESLGIKPDYIIRNGSQFRKLNIDVPTFCLIQDTMNNPMQTEVINSSTVVVFASKHCYEKYKDRISPKNVRIIQQSSDFNFFKPIPERHPEVLPNSVLFIGDSSVVKKGFNIVLDIIQKMSDFNFCLVMKDNTTLESIPEYCRNRVRIFNRVNRETVRLLINSCVVAICTSGYEEGHFAGIEIGACDVPMVTRPMGCYLDRSDDMSWGEYAKDDEFPEKIREVVVNRSRQSPRKQYSKEYTLERCREKWQAVIDEFVV